MFKDSQENKKALTLIRKRDKIRIKKIINSKEPHERYYSQIKEKIEKYHD